MTVATPSPELRAAQRPAAVLGALRWSADRAHLPLAGVLTAYLAFHAGGYFPGSTGVAAVVLALALVLRVTLAPRPFGGWGPAAALVCGALALLAGWTLLSGSWSGAQERALLEADRTLLYLLALIFYATVPWRPGALAGLLRWVLAAAFAVAAAGIAARLLPDATGVREALELERLSSPLTYWNATGLLCGVGVILALHAASGREEPWPVRALATGALPLLALTLYLTFSRGAIAATILGAAVYAIAARPRRLPATLLVGGTATWVTLSTAYRADLIGTVHYRSPAGLLEGHHVARVVVWAAALALLARLLLVPLEHRLDRLGGERPVRPRVAAGLAAGALMLALIVALAAGAPHRLRVEIDAFSRGNTISETGNARDRLGAVGNNGRLGLWRVARADAREHRFHGSGAGTFRVQWLERRPSGILLVNDAHSLYLETLAELGIVGFALLCVALGGVLVAALVRALGPLRGPAAAVLAAGVAVAAHAGIDWDWEMPALMVWLWAAGGMLLARGAERAGAAWEPPRLTRVVAGLLCLLVALMPFLVARSQAALDRSTRAFDRGDCPQAVDAALDSLDALRVRSQPYEVLAWCDGRAGQWTLAIGAMRAARARDPLDWRYAYGLAVVEAAAGQDPRGAVRDAVRLNPRYAQVQWLARAMRGHSRARWQRAAFAAQLPVNG